MRHKYKITSPLFLRIPADQLLFFRFQIKWIPHLMPVFFRHRFLNLSKLHRRNLLYLRQSDIKYLKLPVIIFRKQLHRILKISGLHRHYVFEPVDITHLKIQAGIFIQMTLRIVLLRAEYRRRLKYPVKHSHHHLLVELRALRQHCRTMKIIQLKDIGSALRSFRADLRRVDLCKSLSIKEIPKRPCQPFLNPELRAFSHVSQ